MNLLAKCITRNWKVGALSLLMAALKMFFILTNPLIFQHIIDHYVMRQGHYTTPEFLRGVGLWLSISITSVFLSIIARGYQDYYTKLLACRTGAALYSRAISKLLSLPFTTLEAQKSGATLGKLQTARDDAERFLIASVNNSFSAVIGIVIVTIYVTSICSALVVTFLLALPVVALLSAYFGRKVTTLQTTIHGETAALKGSIVETLRNVELVKVLGLAKQEIERLNLDCARLLDLEVGKDRYLRSVKMWQTMSSVFVHDTVFCLLLFLIFKHEISTGQYITVYIYSFYVFGPLQEVGPTINNYRQTAVSLSAFEELMVLPSEPRPAHTSFLRNINSLTFSQVSFSHPATGQPILIDLSFTVASGETIAFVGPSGAGKTTVVKLLVQLYSPQSGKIMYNGVDSNSVDTEDLRRQIGFVTQDSYIFSGTIRDNLRFAAPQANDEDCLDALHRARLGEVLERTSDGLDTVIGEAGINLSGGEKQRLAIARALIRKPRLIIFDEATSALDPATEESVTRTIRELAHYSEVATVLIAHRLSTVMHANRIYVLEKGKIVEEGSHERLVSMGGLYQALWRLQTGGSPVELANHLTTSKG